jgi:DNA polymerase-3 subunit gamma/tau
MEDFIVSARKYRPASFDAVVGQEAITQTLIKAIENNHLAQAFLFNGPRGVGKTTCARILAREINHFHSEGVDEGQDFAFNIFELDAASNSGVDDIRSLIDQVRVPPQIGKYKVYIIDEVHMLSKAAFNAFLKTLEEPPSYAIFILATTEKHKVLPTIISRCQVFDFNRIQITDMVKHLAKIAEKENIKIEESALHVISEKADGALRDALSIFDQMVSFSGNEVTYQNVIDNLNILDYDYYFALCRAFSNSDTETALTTFHEILNHGFDGHNFINGLANHIRNLLMCLTPRTVNILDLGETVKQEYLKDAPNYSSDMLVGALELLGKADVDYKSSRNQRLLVEILLLRLCSLFGGAEKKNVSNEPVIATAKPGSKINPNLKVEVPKMRTATVEDAAAAPTPKSEPLPQPSPKPSQEESTEISDETKEETPPTEEEPTESIAGHASSSPSVEEPPAENTPKQNELKDDESSQPAGKTKLKFGNGRATGLPSLSSMRDQFQQDDKKKADDDELEGESFEGKPADSFDLKTLWEAWKEYAAKIKEADKQSYYVTLTKHDPVMVEENQIQFLVDNHVQVSDLQQDKGNLLDFLRERLNNWKIQLEVVMDESEKKDGDSLYNPNDKFAAMVEKNPLLKKFKDQFDLDIDHDV